MDTASNPSPINHAQIYPQPELRVLDIDAFNSQAYCEQNLEEIQTLRVGEPNGTQIQYIKDLEDLPFHEAEYKQASLQRKITLADMDKEEVQRYKAEWHWDQFFEFAFYHLVYLIFLGPFANVIFFRNPGYIAMRNMHFCGTSLFAKFQFIIWLNITMNTLYYFWQKNDTIGFTEILFMWCAIIQRTVVIAAKYATLSPDRIYLYKHEYLTDDQRLADMFIYVWRLQTPKIKSLELYRALKRHSLDMNNFRFNFIVPVTEVTKNKIKATKLELQNLLSGMQTLEKDEFCGYQIIGFVIDKYQEMIKNGDNLVAFSQLLSILLTLTPILYMAPHIYSMYSDTLFGIMQTVRILFNFYMSFGLYFGSYAFLTLGIYDQKRKIYILTQCQYMLSTSQLQLDYPKLVPTIDIYNHRSLKAWAIMRTVGYDYGAEYHLRSQGFYSFIFLTSIAFFLTFLIILLDLHTFGDLELTLISEMATIIITHIAFYLYYGARLNQFFETFNSQLQDLRSVYVDVSSNKEDYFTKNLEPRSFMHKKIVDHIKLHVGNDITKVDGYLKGIIKTVKDTVTTLEFDQRNHPFQLYGITVTFNLLKSIFVGLATVIGYALQQRMNTKEQKQ